MSAKTLIILDIAAFIITLCLLGMMLIPEVPDFMRAIAGIAGILISSGACIASSVFKDNAECEEQDAGRFAEKSLMPHE